MICVATCFSVQGSRAPQSSGGSSFRPVASQWHPNVCQTSHTEMPQPVGRFDLVRAHRVRQRQHANLCTAASDGTCMADAHEQGPNFARQTRCRSVCCVRCKTAERMTDWSVRAPCNAAWRGAGTERGCAAAAAALAPAAKRRTVDAKQGKLRAAASGCAAENGSGKPHGGHASGPPNARWRASCVTKRCINQRNAVRACVAAHSTAITTHDGAHGYIDNVSHFVS